MFIIDAKRKVERVLGIDRDLVFKLGLSYLKNHSILLLLASGIAMSVEASQKPI